ncbi:MAG: hypothetical protein A2Y24_00245 [Clostridiales bacterium GWE2_32_10]|nr:MAG: hypothetical protein A2Y24_00245 [Clostridiales bacterium GWE2_32_10]HBY21347.1 hypothetical protein [Clostridiales bacterium]
MNLLLIGLLGIAIIGTTVFHIAEKSINKEINSFFALAVAYFFGFIMVTSLMFIIYPNINLQENFDKINFAVVLLSISSIGFELSILLSYRLGEKISKLVNIITPGVAIMLVLIGIFSYNEKLSMYNIIGLILGMTGIYLISGNEEEV